METSPVGKSGEGFVGFKRERGFNSHLCPRSEEVLVIYDLQRGTTLGTHLGGAWELVAFRA